MMAHRNKPAPTPENIRLICDISLVLMLLAFDPGDFRGYMTATEMSCQYPMGSYENIFWWSTRTLWSDPPPAESRVEIFWEYFAWKLDQYEKGHIVGREAPLFGGRR